MMSLAHEHGFVLIGLAGPMDVVDLSLSLSLTTHEDCNWKRLVSTVVMIWPKKRHVEDIAMHWFAKRQP